MRQDIRVPRSQEEHWVLIAVRMLIARICICGCQCELSVTPLSARLWGRRVCVENPITMPAQMMQDLITHLSVDADASFGIICEGMYVGRSS